MANIITWVSLAAIFLVFILFMIELRKVRSANKLISSLLGTDNIIDSFAGTKLEELGEVYRKTVNVAVPNGTKTNIAKE